MKTKKTLTQALVRTHFNYDPISGILIRKDLPNPKPVTGKFVSLKQNIYPTARVIYAYMVSEPPQGVVMRIDRDPLNNKWENFTTTIDAGKRKIPSKQKRTAELSSDEMQEIFRLDINQTESGRREYTLWFLLPPEPIRVTRQTLRFKYKGIMHVRTKAHVIQRMLAILSGDTHLNPHAAEARRKRRETQRLKALVKAGVL